MKKLGIVAGVFFLLIIGGILLIGIRRPSADVTAKRTKVGLILNGSSQDASWGQACYEGMERCRDELNLEVFYRESVPTDETCKDVMEELIGQGCEIILCNSYGYGVYELEEAEAHPDIYFYHASGVEERENLATYFGRIYQMRYLSGIVAGLQTETDEIGYVAAFPIPEVNRGINAFTLGVRRVNPDAEVHVAWTHSWEGDAESEAAYERLTAACPIDVLTIHTDSVRPLELAERDGVWCIGYNRDNSDRYPNTYLTAPVWHWENFYRPRILECLQGKFQGRHYWEDVRTGVVDLAPLTGNVKDGIREAVEKEKERLMSGTFDVFYGPIRDRDGRERIAAGESMSDDAMLNEFDWYVEGVVPDEE